MKEIGRRVMLAVAMLAIVVMLGLAVLTRPTSGSHVDPVYVGYDASCANLAPPGTVWHELRITPVADGVYSDEWITVSLDVHEGDDDDDDVHGDGDDDDDDEDTTVDWSANIGVDGVFVKGGPGGYFYRYVPATGDDTGLTAPRRYDDDDDDDDFGEGGDDDEHYDPEHMLFCAVVPPNTPAATATPQLTSTPPGSETSTPTPSPTGTPVGATATPVHMTEQMYFPAICSGCLVGPGEPNNTCPAAHAIQVNTRYDFFPDDVHDWYRFQLTSPSEVEVRVEDFMPLEGQLAAYAGASCENALLLGNSGERASQKTLSLGRQPAGTYYVYVSNDGTFNNSEPYGLIVETR